MVLNRMGVCHLIGFNSWTAVQAWTHVVATVAYMELEKDYLRPHERIGLRTPPGNIYTKDFFVNNADDLERRVNLRVSEIERNARTHPDKSLWGTGLHYEHFIVDALAEDRLASRQRPRGNYLSTRAYAADPATLIANMYELTDAICHNYWKTAETDQWDPYDSDIPFTDADDIADFDN
ncbi:uncharacterized protein B0H64DRAFT_414574 [Chaetomium fimeti]|uniref:Uncharacterized protein n=1 Tax=Chaetomium fimeti TaxID=1854472 RepID=A0AAE0LX87_9PEZI|nr:hypothetical protein B0H64DRAFT_414574 [Chaetomium fimeti]